MNTKLLRQQILDLAIRGKLVKQDPNDEPASVLLERIRAEKEQLIQQGKIKKTKASATTDTPHYQNTPFDIPTSWQWARLGEITLNRDAERVPLSSAVRKKQTNKRYNYYGASGVIDKVDNYLFEDRLLLVGEDGANLLSRSKDNAFFAEGRYWVNNHAHVIDSTDKLILDYVAIVINSTPLDKYITGSAQPKFTQDNLNNFPIPLPPLAEQKRIVAEIEKWFALIDELDANKQDLQAAIRQVRAKVLDLAIHGKLVSQDPNDEPAIALLRRINPHYTPSDTSHYQNVPQGWEVTTLENVCKIVTTQKYQIKQSEIKEAGKYPVISQSANYIEGYCDRADKLYTKSPVVIFGDHTRAVKFIDFEFVVGADGVKIFIPLLSPKYTYYLICYAASQIENKGYARHYSLLSKVPLFIPPLKEQKRIVNAIDAILEVMDIISAEL